LIQAYLAIIVYARPVAASEPSCDVATLHNNFVFNNQTWQNAEWHNQYERMITSYYRTRI